MSSSSSSFAEIAPRYDRLRPLLEGDRRRITKLLEGIKTGDTILEVGCGTGRYTIPIAELSRARLHGHARPPAQAAHEGFQAGSSRAPPGRATHQLDLHAEPHREQLLKR